MLVEGFARCTFSQGGSDLSQPNGWNGAPVDGYDARTTYPRD
jgi:hypothetical protein